MSDVEYYWRMMPASYALTVALEIPVLLLFLSRAHSWRRRLASGFWLTACTYPIVYIVLPLLFDIRNTPAHYRAYLIVAETFAPLAECLLFALAFHNGDTPRADRWRDFAAITAANLASFILGSFIPLEKWMGVGTGA